MNGYCTVEGVCKADQYLGRCNDPEGCCYCPRDTTDYATGRTTQCKCPSFAPLVRDPREYYGSCECAAGLSFISDDFGCVCDANSGFYSTNRKTVNGFTIPFGNQPCQKCPDGCTPTNRQSRPLYVVASTCSCSGSNRIFVRNSNSVYQCPNGMERTVTAVDDNPSGPGNLCKCSVSGQVKSPDGSSCVCTGGKIVDTASNSCICPGTSVADGNGVCQCPPSFVFDSAGTTCVCPTNTLYDSVAKQCIVCYGAYGPQVDGTCGCAVGAKRDSSNICRCDAKTGYYPNPLGNGCSRCDDLQVPDGNGNCVCDTASNVGSYRDPNGRTCVQCPSNATPLSALPACKCIDSAAVYSFANRECRCVAAGAAMIDGKCYGPCPARSTLDTTSGACVCNSPYVPATIGDTSASVNCICPAGTGTDPATGAVCQPCTAADRAIIDGVCACDTSKGYGRASAGSGGGYYCSKCPADSVPSLGADGPCMCTDTTAQLVTDTSGALSCRSATSCTTGQTFSTALGRCQYDCPPNSYRPSPMTDTCICNSGWTAQDPSSVSVPGLTCVQCNSDQSILQGGLGGCFCTATGTLGSCPILPSGGVTQGRRRALLSPCDWGEQFCNVTTSEGRWETMVSLERMQN